MARASVRSVPRPTHSRQPTLNGPLRRWLARELRTLRAAVRASAARCQAERYRKHFDTFAHTTLLLFHGLSGSPSLRQSYGAFATCSGLVALSGLGSPHRAPEAGLRVSFSQVAASNTSRPAAALAGVLPALTARVRALTTVPGAAPPGDLPPLDSTFLRVALRYARWLPSRGGADVPGVRLQVPYTPALDLPEQVLITDTRTTDHQGLALTALDQPARLAALRGHTLAFDLGYYCHRHFAQLCAADVPFVTRRHQQARLTVEADQPVQGPLPDTPPGRITVEADQRITLGSPNNRRGAVLPGLRRVIALVAPQPAAARRGAEPVRYELVTDRWDLLAHEVDQLYLWRWQSELFFRWLKRYVRLPRLLGCSPNAVELTLCLALLVHLLTVLAAHQLGWARCSPTLLRRLAWLLGHLTAADRDACQAPALQLPLPFPDWGLPEPRPP